MKVIRETAVAGRVIYRNLKVPSGNHKDNRSARHNVTSEKVQKNNDRLAVRNLMLILDNNFDGTGSHVTLTYYGNEPSLKQAARDRSVFIRILRKEMRKQGKDLKYVAVTEYENKRIHHHIVINSQDIELVNSIWAKGFVNFKALDSNGDYYKLAEYLIKETTKTFRRPDSVHKRRYTCSRNLVRPAIKREAVNVSDLEEDPEPIKGYYIPKDRVRRYQHPITELEHLEYIMIALAQPRQYKQWPRGEKVSGREYFKSDYEEVQESLFDFDV